MSGVSEFPGASTHLTAEAFLMSQVEEAAVEALHFKHGLTMEQSEQFARTALNETARTLAAKAWDEGAEASIQALNDHIRHGKADRLVNPYRSKHGD